MAEKQEAYRQISETEILKLVSAFNWLQGFVEGAGGKIPTDVANTIWEFTPPYARFEEDRGLFHQRKNSDATA